MAVGQLIFSSVLMFTFHVFLLFSCLNNLSHYSNWRFSSIGHGFDTPGSAPEPSSMPYLDPSSFCRIRHFGLKSWYKRMKRRRFLRRRLLYSANGTASFNPSLLENNLSATFIHILDQTLLLILHLHRRTQILAFPATRSQTSGLLI